ncbi:hypothetical protein HNR46_003852 [Haloferula luteola]|uniref:Uncharacterized protein n=1 Tax=Haloferula luteola TaxID=595692 RepID=A0A840VLU0_9BACT|nr:hypothetical protein [Haloferula luteola]MBB5353591.1 hypothetical protein [Haloferula luteola]
MKFKFPSLVLAFLAHAISISHGQALGDTDIEGDLNVLLDSAGAKGNLRVEGVSKLAQSPASLSQQVKDSLDLAQADFYGPVQIGPYTHRVELFFAKESPSDVTYLGLPIGFLSGVTRATVHASVLHWGSGESASWDVRGSRHGSLKCLHHVSYGNASRFKIRGTMSHGNMFMLLDFDGEGLAADVTWIKVTVEFEGSNPTGSAFNEGVLSVDPQSYGNYTKDIEIINSTSYGKVRGLRGQEERGLPLDIETSLNAEKLTISGQVILKQAQGDVSMGVFGD